jgi:hypothetical protein
MVMEFSGPSDWRLVLDGRYPTAFGVLGVRYIIAVKISRYFLAS